MDFVEGVKRFVTGKSKNERLADRAAQRIIREKSSAAYRKAKLLEAEKYAVEKAKLEYSRKLERLKNPVRYSSPFGNSFMPPVSSRKSSRIRPSNTPSYSQRFDIISGTRR